MSCIKNKVPCILFDLIVLFYMDSLNKTSKSFYIKVHEVKKASKTSVR